MSGGHLSSPGLTICASVTSLHDVGIRSLVLHRSCPFGFHQTLANPLTYARQVEGGVIIPYRLVACTPGHT